MDGVFELPQDSGHMAAVTQYRVVNAAASKDRSHVTCQMDEEAGPAVAYCETCALFACADCVKSHKKLKLFSSHRIVELTAVAPAVPSAGAFRRPVCCREHAAETIRTYCNTCKKAACVMCSIVKHKAHDVVDLDTAGDGMRERLRAAIAAIGFDRGAEATFKSALAAKISVVTGANASTKAGLYAVRAELVAAVHSRFDALISETDALLAGQLAGLRAQSKIVELHMDGVAHAVAFARDVEEHGSYSEVGVTYDTTLARLAGAKEEHAAVPWTPACEGPARAVLATGGDAASWMARTCKFVTAREIAESERAAAEVAAAAAAAEQKRAEDAATAARLRLRGESLFELA